MGTDFEQSGRSRQPVNPENLENQDLQNIASRSSNTAMDEVLTHWFVSIVGNGSERRNFTGLQNQDETEHEHEHEHHNEGDPPAGEQTPQTPAQVVQSMLVSSDQTTRADGQRLQQMLNGNADQRDLANLMAGNLEPAQIHQMLGVLDNPQMAQAADQIVQMLRNQQGLLGDGFSAMNLLNMLGSQNQTERQDGQRLLTMLNNPQERALAQRLLGGLGGNESLHQFLEMWNNPQQRQRAQEIAAMLTSDNSTQNAAGNALLSMLGSTDQAVRTDGERLMTMLGQQANRDNALAILANLDSPEQRHRMLEIMNNQGQQQAAQQLLRMLRSEEQRDSATTVLDLLNSNHAPQQQDGQRLLTMLNGNIQQRQLAERILDVGDVERRHQIINLASNPQNLGAAQWLMDMRDSRDRRQRDSAGRLLDLLESNSERDQTLGRDLVSLLNNPQRRDAVGSMLRWLDNDSQVRQMVSILNDPKREATANHLVTMLNGTADQREALRNLLDLSARAMGADANPGIDRFGARGGDQQLQQDMNRLLDMLGDPQRRANAETVLAKLQDATQIHQMLELMNTPAQQRAVEQMLQMLRSQNPTEVESARNLLRMLSTTGGGDAGAKGREGARPVPGDRQAGQGAPADSPERRDALALLAMLNDPQRSETARQMMRLASNPRELHGLMQLQASPNHQQDFQQLMTMLGDVNKASEARAILGNLGSADMIHKMLEIMNDENQRGASQAILRMLSEENPRAGIRLLAGLTSTNQAERQTAQRLQAMLNTDTYDMRPQQILEGTTSVAAARQLLDMLDDPEKRAAANQLISLLGSGEVRQVNGANAVLELLRSQNEAERADGQRLLAMLNDPEKRDNAHKIIELLNDPQQVHTMLAILNDPQQSRAAQELMRLLGQNEETQQAVRDLINGLIDPNQRENAQRLLSMLNTEAQLPAARAIMTQLQSNAERQALLRMLNTEGQREAGNQLLAMLTSGTGQEQRGARALLERAAASAESVRPVLEMLNDPQKREQARRLMSTFTDSQELAQLLSILNDPARQAAATQLMEMINSNDQAQREGVRHLMELLAQEERSAGRLAPGDRGTSVGQNILDQLANPQQRAAAREMLALTASAQQLRTLSSLLSNRVQAQTAQAMMTMLRDAQRRETAQTMLENLGTSENIQTMLSILNNAQHREAAQQLLGMLNNDETRSSALTLINVMQADAAAGNQLLSMMGSEDSRLNEQALNILAARLQSQQISRLLQIMGNQQLRYAADSLMEMLRPGDDNEANVVGGLLSMLNGNPADRAEGERLLSMLNQRSQDYTALRLLRRRFPPLPFKN